MEAQKTVFILGGGPSLQGFDFDSLAGKNCIAINNAMFNAPTSIGYFCDKDWFIQHESKLKERGGRIIRGYLPGDQLDLDWVDEWEFTAERGLVLEPHCLAHGFNSGAAAINLAVQLGYKRIYLLGYDMGVVRGRKNFHTDHRRTTPHYAYQSQFIPSFTALVEPLRAMGIEVINATPGSALNVFPSASLTQGRADANVVLAS